MLDLLALSKSQRGFLAEAAERYHQTVEDVAPYLASRGVTREAAVSFRLGGVSDPMPGHERFRGMVSIPYLSPNGVLGFKFRCTMNHEGTCKENGHAKYDSPSGQGARLYNVNAFHEGGDVIAIVEGEMKALICSSLVGVPAVGTPGTQWVKEHPHWPRCFADYERVIVVADHDLDENGKQDPGKGVGHAKKIVSTLQGADLVVPPPGLDLDEWVLRDGVDAVRKAMGL